MGRWHSARDKSQLPILPCAPDPGSFSRIYPAVQPRRPWEDTAETLFSCLPQVTGSVSPELSSHVPEGGTSIKLSTLARGQADHHAGTSIQGPAGNITREPLAQTPGAMVLSDTPFLSQATCSMSCGREREREADLARAQRQDFVLSCRGVPAGALQADPGCKRAQTARLHAGCKLGCRLSSADSPLPHLFPFRSPPTRFPAPCAAPLISPSLRSWWLHPGAAAA